VTIRRQILLGALLLVAVVGLFVAAFRYTRRISEQLEQPSGKPVTLRFFSDPKPLQAFTMQDLDGRQISTSDWRGKVVFVNFWATWCLPCRAEIPDLVALQEKYREQLQIIGVSEDEGSPEAVRRFASEHKVNYPIVMFTPELKRYFTNVYALPTTFVIDRETRIVQKHLGMLTPTITEMEARALAGLDVNASIEKVDPDQPVKLENAAEVTSIPGVDLAHLSPERRLEAVQKLNAEGCTCGCDLTIAKCRIDDPQCPVSLPRARAIVEEIAKRP
jgi:cytochrome c biogenesis protein CcmG/thiol:disulfide interchange protein DsbE